MKNEVLGLISALIGGIMMMVITKTNSFKSASDNVLMIILLLFAVSICGLGIGKLTTMFFDDSIKTTKKKKKNFNYSDDKGFIGDDLR